MSLAQTIDHTLLRADATEGQIVQLCDEACEHRFFSVCINPYWIQYCANYLEGSGVLVCTVAGFPLGATLALAKQYEAAQCAQAGAREVDMVLNVGALRSGLLSDVEADIRGCAEAVHRAGARLKVILETALLNDAQKEVACRLAVAAGADFVKTSTGFASGGATIEDVELMRRAVGPNIGVKASGGIRDYATAKAMLDAGANRLGTSSGVAIISGSPANGSAY